MKARRSRAWYEAKEASRHITSVRFATRRASESDKALAAGFARFQRTARRDLLVRVWPLARGASSAIPSVPVDVLLAPTPELPRRDVTAALVAIGFAPARAAAISNDENTTTAVKRRRYACEGYRLMDATKDVPTPHAGVKYCERYYCETRPSRTPRRGVSS